MPDINTVSYASENGVVISDLIFNPNPGDSDTLKFSNCTNFTVERCEIVGGKEDCIDMNRGSLGYVTNCNLRPTGNFAMTIKGGFKDLVLENIILDSHGKEVDIDLGNWSCQGKWAWTSGIILKNVTAADGKPVIVRVLWASSPKVIGGNVKVKNWQIAGFFYLLFKTIVSKFSK